MAAVVSLNAKTAKRLPFIVDLPVIADVLDEGSLSVRFIGCWARCRQVGSALIGIGADPVV
jgi:hypothetical protein